MMEHNIYGYIPSPPDKRDYTLDMFVQGVVEKPRTFIQPYITPIYNQGNTGMCGAFTLAELVEIFHHKETGEAKRFSPGYIYGYDSWIFEGIMLRYAIDKLCTDGTCAFEEFPMIADKNACYQELLKVATPDLKERAKQQRIKSYLKLNTAEEIKTALFTLGAVVAGYLLYDSFNSVGKNGIVRMPNKETEKLIGGHAMLIVGYDDDKGCFIVLNSYGSYWGDKGICYIPYEYLPNEAWTIADYVPPKWQLEMWLGKKEYVVNGTTKIMDSAPITGENTRTLVPIRLVAEELGVNVEWEQATKKITLSK